MIPSSALSTSTRYVSLRSTFFSEDEFTGDWKIEVIGTDAQWELIHNNEETTLIVDNNSSKENITINTTGSRYNSGRVRKKTLKFLVKSSA